MSENSVILIAQRSEPSGNPPTGYIYWWANGGAIYTKDDGGNVSSQTTPVFGNCFEETSNDTDDTNSTTTYKNHATITKTSCAAGKYRIGMFAIWRMNTTSYNIQIQVTVNGTEIGLMEVETKDSNSDIRNPDCGFVYYTHTGGALEVKLNYRPENSSYTAYLYNSKLEIWRVE